MTEIAVVEASIHRCAHDRENPYLMLSVGVTRDSRLSVEDIGFLTILLDHPNNFKFNVPYLVKRCRLSKEKTRKLLNKLIELGYVIANQVRNHGKFLGMIYRVFEKPLTLVKAAVGQVQQQILERTVAAADENSIHGKTVCGNIATNEYEEVLNTRENKLNKNDCMSKGDLKNFEVNVDDQDLVNALLIRNVEPIKDQTVLNAYLDQFNKKAEQYKNLSDMERKSNLAAFIKLCIKHHNQNEKKLEHREKQPRQPVTGVKTIKQAFFYAKQLTSNNEFALKYGNPGEGPNFFEARVRQNLMHEEYFNKYKGFLIDMGLLHA